MAEVAGDSTKLRYKKVPVVVTVFVVLKNKSKEPDKVRLVGVSIMVEKIYQDNYLDRGAFTCAANEVKVFEVDKTVRHESVDSAGKVTVVKEAVDIGFVSFRKVNVSVLELTKKRVR